MQPIQRSQAVPVPPPTASPPKPAPIERAGPGLPGDSLAARAKARPASEWRLPAEVSKAGPEIRRHLAEHLGADHELASIERRFASGTLDAPTYRALRADRIQRALFDTLNDYHAAAAKAGGISSAYFQVRNHHDLLVMYKEQLGDLDGKLLEDVRWQVFGRYQELADNDPTLRSLKAERERRVAQLPKGSQADRDPRVGELNARIHRQENGLRIQAQADWMKDLDSRVELDAVTRQDLRDFVTRTHAGTLGSGVWTGPLAQVIASVSHRPGEMDGTHAFIGVADGLYYESVTSPPPDKASGVKPTTAAEMFAMFHGRVRTQEVPGGLTATAKQALYDFSLDKQGLPYNVWGLIGGTPGVGKTHAQDASYYCAEFVGRALNAAGLDVWTKAGNTQLDKANPESRLGALERRLPPGLSFSLRAARALPYTVARAIAPRLAARMGSFGLTPDDAIGLPRVSPQKLINGKIDGRRLETTFDRTQAR